MDFGRAIDPIAKDGVLPVKLQPDRFTQFVGTGSDDQGRR